MVAGEFDGVPLQPLTLFRTDYDEGETNMIERAITRAKIAPSGALVRRDFLKTIGLGTGALALGWHDWLLAASPALSKNAKSVIVLWMQGGPTQFETFDPKPGSDGCQTGTIQTAVPGIQIADFWPHVAKQMGDIALIRSMTNKEGNHQRATYQLHTGYVPSGTLRHPALGSAIVKEIGRKDFDLPSFVAINGPSQGSGFLPAAYGPFRVSDPSQLPANTEIPVSAERFERRLGLLSRLESPYAKLAARRRVENHKDLYGQAARMVTSPRLATFDIAREPEKLKAEYGDNPFGQGCLLARRLVETGVTYIEVMLTGWDTHNQNKDRVEKLAGQCDRAYARLLSDLKERGKLESTLVLWMGEFGRTPKINPNGGRDHFPRAFSVAVSGCGIKGGQVIGKTNADGTAVADRPVAVNDLFCTLVGALGIAPEKENQSPVGRPIKIVDGGQRIKELVA